MREIFRQERIGDRTVHIYLPPSYSESRDSFPVVYVQDGRELVDDCLNLLEYKFRVKELPELIFVGIEPIKRNDEYTPWPATSLREGYPDFGGKGGEYVSYLADTLKPYIDRTYRTRDEPVHTGIAGASFGGLISIYAACLRPEVFGRIGALSASMWYEGMLSFLRESELPSMDQKLYMSVGSLEGIFKENIQREMVPNNRQAHRMLQEKGVPQERLKFVEEEGGTHDALFFAKHFVEAMTWLFNRE